MDHNEEARLLPYFCKGSLEGEKAKTDSLGCKAKLINLDGAKNCLVFICFDPIYIYDYSYTHIC